VYAVGDLVQHLPTGIFACVRELYPSPDSQPGHAILKVQFDGGSFGAARANTFKLVTRRDKRPASERRDWIWL
jgi:hypothetical protein